MLGVSYIGVVVARLTMPAGRRIRPGPVGLFNFLE